MQVIIMMDIDVAIYHDMVGGDMARVTSLGTGPMDSVQVGKAVFVKEKFFSKSILFLN